MVDDVLEFTSQEYDQVSEDSDTLSPDKMKLKKKSRFYIPKTGDINKHLDKKSKEIVNVNKSDVESVPLKSPRKRQVRLHFESDDVYGNIRKALKYIRNSSIPREGKYHSEDIDEEDRNLDEFSDASQEIFPSFEDEEEMVGGGDSEWDSGIQDFEKREEVKRKMTGFVAPKSDADAGDISKKHARDRLFGEIRVTVKGAPEGEDSSTKPAKRKKPKRRKTDVPRTSTTQSVLPQENAHSSTEKSTLPSANDVPQATVADFSQFPGITFPGPLHPSSHSTQSFTQTESASAHGPQISEISQSFPPTSSDQEQSTSIPRTMKTLTAPTGKSFTLSSPKWTQTMFIPTSSSENTEGTTSATISFSRKSSSSQRKIESSQVTTATESISSSTLGEIPWTETQISSPQDVLPSKATTAAPPTRDTSPPGTSTTTATRTTWQPSTAPETSMEVQPSTLHIVPPQIPQHTWSFSSTPPAAKMSTRAIVSTDTQGSVPKIELPSTSKYGMRRFLPRVDFRGLTPMDLPTTQRVVPRMDARTAIPFDESPVVKGLRNDPDDDANEVGCALTTTFIVSTIGPKGIVEFWSYHKAVADVITP